MEDYAKEMVNKSLPWRKDVKWPVVAIEAAVLVGIGGYILVDTDGARDIIFQLIGAMLLATSLILGFANMRHSGIGLGFFDAFRAGIGATIGAIATISWWSDYVNDHAVRVILGWGLIAYSVLHLVGLIVIRGRAGLRLSTMVVVSLTLVLGVVLLTGDDSTSSSRMTTLGIILLVFGALLAALAYYLATKGKGDTELAG